MQWLFQFLRLFREKRLNVNFFLGFSAGLPLLLTSSTLQAWYTMTNASVLMIGALSFVGQPYIYKFFWAPFYDRFTPPFLGRRRGWLFITQIALIFSIIVLAFMNPAIMPMMTASCAVLVAFLSASQDIAVDAYRTDILLPDERGPGAALNIAGYRLAMILSGGAALIFAQYIGWRNTYLVMAVFILVGLIATLVSDEPKQVTPITSLRHAVIKPFQEFLSRDKAVMILVFLILYKLSFSLSFLMTPTFLLRGLHFSLLDVGVVNKIVGLYATIIGVIIGGALTSYLGLFRALFLFGFLQALGTLSYLGLALYGKHMSLLVFSVTLENLFAGMEATTVVAFIMSLCNKRYTATQFALLSAFATLSRVFIGPLAGYAVAKWGWIHFYWLSGFAAIPGLWLLWRLRDFIDGATLMQENASLNVSIQEYE